MITLKDYQQRVLDSLREFFRLAARTYDPDSAFRNVTRRTCGEADALFPGVGCRAGVAYALCVPARAHRRRQDAACLLCCGVGLARL